MEVTYNNNFKEEFKISNNDQFEHQTTNELSSYPKKLDDTPSSSNNKSDSHGKDLLELAKNRPNYHDYGKNYRFLLVNIIKIVWMY